MSIEERFVLDDALYRLQAKGWRPNGYAFDRSSRQVDPEDDTVIALGMLGALIAAARCAPDPYKAYLQAQACVKAVLGVKHLATWEDERGRSQQEVFEALELAALFADDETPEWKEPFQ